MVFDFRKCATIIFELIKAEENYISQLETGIKLYYQPMLNLVNGPLLANQTNLIFRNVFDILELHQIYLLPKLKTVGQDPLTLIECYKVPLESGAFNAYFTFFSGQSKANQLCMQHRVFFDDLSRTKNALLSLEDFLELPKQMLYRYHYKFDKLINAYGESDSCSDDIKLIIKKMEGVKDLFKKLIEEVNDLVGKEENERVYSPLESNFKLASNVENDIQAGLQRTLSLADEKMDISQLKETGRV